MIFTLLKNIFLIFLSFFSLNHCSQSNTNPLNKVILSGYYTDATFLIHWAQTQSIFKKYGLNVEIKKFQTGREGMENVIKGESDIAIIFDYAFCHFSFKKPDLGIISSISESKATELLYLKERGIKTPTDLKGKKIGITLNTVAEYTLGQFLIRNHLTEKDVKLVHLMPNQFIKSLQNHEIDALISWEPYNYKIKNLLKDKVGSWMANDKQDLYLMLVAKRPWIQKNPKLIESLLNALIESEELILKDSHRAKELFKLFIQIEGDYVEQLWKKMYFRVTLQQSLLNAIEDQSSWIQKNKNMKLNQQPNYLNFFYLDGLKNIRPDKITIFH